MRRILAPLPDQTFKIFTHHSKLAALLDDAVENGIGADVCPNYAVHSADSVHVCRRCVVLLKNPCLRSDGRDGVEFLS